MEKKDTCYLQFPLHLIRGLFLNKEKTINDMIRFGIDYFMSNIKYTFDDVFRQTLYMYYNQPLKLDSFLFNYIDELRYDHDVLEDSSYAYTYDGDFDVNGSDEYAELRRVLSDDLAFKNAAILNYKMHVAADSLKIDISKDTYRMTQIQRANNEPLPMVNLNTLFEFRDNNKEESDIIEFVSYIALRSIIGQKQYCKTNKAHMFARMFGFASIKDQNLNLLNKTQKRIFNRYQERYQFEKLMESLQVNWHLKYYSHYNRGFYIGTDLNLEELVLIAEKQKRSNKNRKLKDKKKMAREKALSELYKN